MNQQLPKVISEIDLNKMAESARKGDFEALSNVANVATAINTYESLHQQFVTNSQLAQLNSTNTQLLKVQQTIKQRTEEIAELNRLQTQLQSQMLDVQTKQLKIQIQLLQITQLQMDLQNQRHKESELRRQRQKQLKDGFFSLKQQIPANLKRIDPLEKYLFFVRQNEEVRRVNLTPDDLDEINDKEYAREVLESLDKHTNEALQQLSNQDIDDLVSLTLAVRKIKSQSSRIKYEKNNLNRLLQQRASLQAEIKAFEKKYSTIYQCLLSMASYLFPSFWYSLVRPRLSFGYYSLRL